jgi:hypothetical protein
MHYELVPGERAHTGYWVVAPLGSYHKLDGTSVNCGLTATEDAVFCRRGRILTRGPDCVIVRADAGADEAEPPVAGLAMATTHALVEAGLVPDSVAQEVVAEAIFETPHAGPSFHRVRRSVDLPLRSRRTHHGLVAAAVREEPFVEGLALVGGLPPAEALLVLGACGPEPNRNAVDDGRTIPSPAFSDESMAEILRRLQPGVLRSLPFSIIRAIVTWGLYSCAEVVAQGWLKAIGELPGLQPRDCPDGFLCEDRTGCRLGPSWWLLGELAKLQPRSELGAHAAIRAACGVGSSAVPLTNSLRAALYWYAGHVGEPLANRRNSIFLCPEMTVEVLRSVPSTNSCFGPRYPAEAAVRQIAVDLASDLPITAPAALSAGNCGGIRGLLAGPLLSPTRRGRLLLAIASVQAEDAPADHGYDERRVVDVEVEDVGELIKRPIGMAAVGRWLRWMGLDLRLHTDHGTLDAVLRRVSTLVSDHPDATVKDGLSTWARWLAAAVAETPGPAEGPRHELVPPRVTARASHGRSSRRR